MRRLSMLSLGIRTAKRSNSRHGISCTIDEKSSCQICKNINDKVGFLLQSKVVLASTNIIVAQGEFDRP